MSLDRTLSVVLKLSRLLLEVVVVRRASRVGIALNPLHEVADLVQVLVVQKLRPIRDLRIVINVAEIAVR